MELAAPHPAARKWLLETRAIPTSDERLVLVSSVCRHLSAEGQCGCYPNRPQACADAPVGGIMCTRVRHAVRNATGKELP